MNVDQILEDCAMRVLQKASSKESDVINLASMRLNCLPDISKVLSGLSAITDINLSKNNLFDGDQLFQVIERQDFLFISYIDFPVYFNNHYFWTISSFGGCWKFAKFDKAKLVREFFEWCAITIGG